MQKKKPFITIAIPSLNRIDSFKLVVQSILKQTFKDYELLIVDDNSVDDIAGYVASLKNEKIRLITHEKRQGFKKVFIKALLEAKGTYVMTLGNDDILCSTNTLQHVYDRLNKKRVGLAKLELIYYYQSPTVPCSSTKLEEEDVYIRPKIYDDFIKAIDDYGVTHIAGTIYLRSLLNKNSFLNNELIPFFKTIVDCGVQRGFLVLANEYIAVGMSTSYLALFSKKRSYKEMWFYVMYTAYKKYIGEVKARNLIVEKMKQQIPYFIAIKSYVGVNEVKTLMKEYQEFEPSFRSDIKMYVSFLASLIFPKIFFIMLRDQRYKRMNKSFQPPKQYTDFVKRNKL